MRMIHKCYEVSVKRELYFILTSNRSVRSENISRSGNIVKSHSFGGKYPSVSVRMNMPRGHVEARILRGPVWFRIRIINKT